MQREARRRDRYSDLYSAVQGRTPIGQPERAKADADVRPLRKGRRVPPLRLRRKWGRIGLSGIESAEVGSNRPKWGRIGRSGIERSLAGMMDDPIGTGRRRPRLRRGPCAPAPTDPRLQVAAASMALLRVTDSASARQRQPAAA
jgi:hypothetical protein